MAALGAVAALPACGDGQAANDDTLRIGLLLSYSGSLAANSINSERAVLLAVETANAAGGVAGRSIGLVARDTRSDTAVVARSAKAVLEEEVAVIIGPDTVPLANQLRTVVPDQTLIMPSFATSDAGNYKPRSWFVMGASPSRMACELVAQLKADGRKKPLVIESAIGYNVLLGLTLAVEHGLPVFFLPTEDGATARAVQSITALQADAYILATLPPVATSVFFSFAAVGALGDPTRWYLSPTLHTPALLETLPRGLVAGARGVSSGTGSGAADFRHRFLTRWGDQPLDDAYPFYDATAIALLALERALARTGVVPTGKELAEHIVAVTQTSGIPVRWNDLPLALQLVRQGQEVGYVGLSGQIEFDNEGNTRTASTNWWTIAESGFTETPRTGECR